MSTMPNSASAADVEKVLKRAGWEKQRSKPGSHRAFKKAGYKWRIIVPDHGSGLLAEGTFRSILKQAGLSREEFFRHLRG